MLVLLSHGALTLSGLMPWSSNYTFLGEVRAGEQTEQVIYKPGRGERPLWDFPRGTLSKREVAAYAVSRTLGWNLVPPTVLRNGPHGRGSVQLFVDVDQDAHFFVLRGDPAFRNALQKLALFDIITNNADRKGGHCLRSGASGIVAIDQGLCFHVEPKLRTVIWDYAGEAIPGDLIADLRRLETKLADPSSNTGRMLRELLSHGEVAALAGRIGEMLSSGTYPTPPDDRRSYPWPLV